MNEEQRSAISQFRELHARGCFILPNPWDIGSAIYLAHLDFRALATTSAGVAFSHGRSDDTPALPLEEMLAHCREISAATPLPVNADFQNGYADEPEGVAENVRRCLTTGVAGLSIEDNSGRTDAPLYEADQAIEHIRAARAVIDASGIPAVLTGRCEAWLVDHPEPFRCALDRLTSYAEAGADCLYAPGVEDEKEIAAIVKAVAPKPVNVLMLRAHAQWSLAQFADLGVRRVSVGSSLACAAWGGFIRAAKRMAEDGKFDRFDEAVPFGEINQLFRDRAARS